MRAPRPSCRPARAASSSSSARAWACCRAGRSSSSSPSSAKTTARRWRGSACRVGVYSLYFPSMLKPVPIRLRAGLWMIARNRETIPPLPAEGRTSMDLPRDAEREFYATIGYLPLGDHAIRADMVERLAAMARQAVRESREAARRAQQEKKPAARAPSPTAPAARRSAAGRRDQRMGDRGCGLRRGRRRAAAARTSPRPKPWPKRRPSKRCAVETPAAAEESRPEEAVDGRAGADGRAAAGAGRSPDRRGEGGRGDGGSAGSRRSRRPKSPKPKRPREGPAAAAARLVPRHAADDVAGRLLGARDGQRAARAGLPRPSAVGGDTGRSTPSRSSRASCASARSSASASASSSASSASSAAANGRSGRTSGSSSPTRRVPSAARTSGGATARARMAPARRARRTRDRRDEGPRPEGDRPREDRRGPRPPRRDSGGPALRLYATTEKKSDAPAADSPFAKLLELKLGGKK